MLILASLILVLRICTYIISKDIIKHFGVFSRWNNYGIIWFYLGLGIGLEASRNNGKKNLATLW
jgi:hypothetical protein